MRASGTPTRTLFHNQTKLMKQAFTRTLINEDMKPGFNPLQFESNPVSRWSIYPSGSTISRLFPNIVSYKSGLDIAVYIELSNSFLYPNMRAKLRKG